MEVGLSQLTGKARERYVQEMFTRISSRYDLMNRLMTAGQDVRWRQEVIRRLHLAPGSLLLDLGAGTGDLARAALAQTPGCIPIAADFTFQMMLVGRQRRTSDALAQRIRWLNANAVQLPFPAESFDAVASGFLLRNLSDLAGSLAEQYRVLKPGGRLVALDTTPPPHNLLTPFIRIHLHTVIPTLGRLIAGQSEAYQYLPDSTESFLEPEQVAIRLANAGFVEVGFQRLMFGTVAIYWGLKIG